MALKYSVNRFVSHSKADMTKCVICGSNEKKFIVFPPPKCIIKAEIRAATVVAPRVAALLLNPNVYIWRPKSPRDGVNINNGTRLGFKLF